MDNFTMIQQHTPQLTCRRASISYCQQTYTNSGNMVAYTHKGESDVCLRRNIGDRFLAPFPNQLSGHPPIYCQIVKGQSRENPSSAQKCKQIE